MLDYTDNELIWAVRNDFKVFTRLCFSTIAPSVSFADNWHIELLCDHLEALRIGKISRLLINIPPGHMKSIICNVAWPAWCLGHDAGDWIISASASKELTITMSRNCRDVMRTSWYRMAFPDTVIRADADNKGRFTTTKNGHRAAITVGTRVIGDNAHKLIVDDPLDPTDASSIILRQRCIDWYKEKFRHRLRSQGAVCVIMQRLRDDDLAGWILANEAKEWHHVNLPLYAEQDEYHELLLSDKAFVRKKGEILHASHPAMTEKKLREIKSDAYSFSAQYQQRPVPKGGVVFDRQWLRWFDNEEGAHVGMNIYILVDPNNSKKKSSDFTCMWVVGLAADRNIYILDCVHEHMNMNDRITMLFKLHRKWQPIAVAYEKFMSDIEQITEYGNRINYRINIEEVAFKGDARHKDQRIERLVPYFANHRVYLPRYGIYAKMQNGSRCDLVTRFIDEEYSKFPYFAKNDDMLDSLSRICDLNLSWPAATNKEPYSYAPSKEQRATDSWLTV